MAGGLVAGCGSHSGGPPSAADSEFIDAVHQNAPDIGSFRSDTELVRLGHATCDDFRSGASYQEIADRLRVQEGSHPLPAQDLGAVITSAVQAYCPRFVSDIS